MAFPVGDKYSVFHNYSYQDKSFVISTLDWLSAPARKVFGGRSVNVLNKSISEENSIVERVILACSIAFLYRFVFPLGIIPLASLALKCMTLPWFWESSKVELQYKETVKLIDEVHRCFDSSYEEAVSKLSANPNLCEQAGMASTLFKNTEKQIEQIDLSSIFYLREDIKTAIELLNSVGYNTQKLRDPLSVKASRVIEQQIKELKEPLPFAFWVDPIKSFSVVRPQEANRLINMAVKTNLQNANAKGEYFFLSASDVIYFIDRAIGVQNLDQFKACCEVLLEPKEGALGIGENQFSGMSSWHLKVAVKAEMAEKLISECVRREMIVTGRKKDDAFIKGLGQIFRSEYTNVNAYRFLSQKMQENETIIEELRDIDAALQACEQNFSKRVDELKKSPPKDSRGLMRCCDEFTKLFNAIEKYYKGPGESEYFAKLSDFIDAQIRFIQHTLEGEGVGAIAQQEESKRILKELERLVDTGYSFIGNSLTQEEKFFKLLHMEKISYLNKIMVSVMDLASEIIKVKHSCLAEIPA